MLLFLRFFLVLYGFVALATGFMGTTFKFNPSLSNAIADNNHRFVAAIWMAMSLAFFYTAWYPTETVLFRFLMISVFIGGVVRAAALKNYPPTPFLIFLILIELIPTVLMLWFQIKLLNAGSL